MRRHLPNTRLAALCTATLAVSAGPTGAQTDPAMVSGIGWNAQTIFTVGDTFGSYTPPGLLDGTFAYPASGGALFLVNHELNPGSGHAYTLANGTQLTGARVSAFHVRRDEGAFRVTDVAVEGASLIVTKRDEFAAVVRRDGLDALLPRMRKQVEE